MHALITGGNGYIGTHLAIKLLQNGHKVTTLDSMFNAVQSSYDFNKHSHLLRRFDASINNIDRLYAAMSTVDIIYHLAARMDDSPNYRHVVRLTNTNIVGAANIVAMARRAGIDRIVYTSTAAVYGNLVGAKETDKPNPVNLYGATKLAAENLFLAAYQTGLDVVVLRLFNVWGGENSRSVVSCFCSGKTVINGDGRQTRDFVHINDVTTALLHASIWDSNIYNIGSGVEVSIAGLYELIANGKPAEYVEPVNEIYRSVADTEFTKNTVGWEPTVLLSELKGQEICEA